MEKVVGVNEETGEVNMEVLNDELSRKYINEYFEVAEKIRICKITLKDLHKRLDEIYECFCKHKIIEKIR